MPLPTDWLSLGALAVMVGLVSELISTVTLFFWIKRTEKRILQDFAGFIDTLLSDIQKNPKQYADIAAPAFKMLMRSLGNMALEGLDDRAAMIEKLPVSVKGIPIRSTVQLFEFLRKKKNGEEQGKQGNAKSPFG